MNVARCVSAQRCDFTMEIVGFLSSLVWFGVIHELSAANEE